MILAGLQKMTLVDFPGKVAATVFTRGCSFRCHFCHNPELVIPEQFLPEMSERGFFDFLESRLGKLQGVCVTGGEPLLHPDADKFISHIKALGYAVKLDTNGSFPDRLEKIIKDQDVDYIAMDIKAPLKKYQSVANPKSEILNPKQIQNPKSKKIEAKIQRSIGLIMNSGIDYEFRTTVCHPLHEVDDFKKIGEMIKGAKRYYIQNFVQSKHINPKIKFEPFSDKELKDAQKIIQNYVESVEIR